jgi:hypothetical protein
MPGRRLLFEPMPLVFNGGTYSDVFGLKNNKTVTETLEHPRYRKFQTMIDSAYGEYLDWNLGDFLLELKRSGNKDYKLFLNKYGDLTYCTFSLNGEPKARERGIYIFLVNGEVMYVGRCRDEFGKRVNQGYGKIHPKNCYLDGQATNCHLNNLIGQEVQSEVAFYAHAMEDAMEIEKVERELITRYRPAWNIALRNTRS